MAEGLFHSMFVLSGQGCVCLKRLYIHENIYSAVTDALIAVARSARVGDGFDPDTRLGPVQNPLAVPTAQIRLGGDLQKVELYVAVYRIDFR